LLEGVPFLGVSDEDARDDRQEDVSGASARAAATWRAMESSPAESLFSLMVAFGGAEEDEDPSVPFDAAVVTGSNTIQLLVRDSAKPGRADVRRAEPVDGRVHGGVRGGGGGGRAAERGRRVQPANRSVPGARDARDGRGDA
jgi:hypothetical protein